MPVAIDYLFMKNSMYTQQGTPNRLLIDLTNPYDAAAILLNEVRFAETIKQAIQISTTFLGGVPYQEFDHDVDTVRSFTMFYLWRDMDERKASRSYKDGLYMAKLGNKYRERRPAKDSGKSTQQFTNTPQRARALPNPMNPRTINNDDD